MYSPDPFRIEDDQAVHAFMRSNPFATVVSCTGERIVATHMPIERLKDGSYYGHFARNNPQSALKEEQEVCAIFTGPHAYVSPSMYVSEFNVPTWNYSAIHCYGSVAFIEDETKVWRLFQELVERYEGESGWRLPDDERYKNLTGYLRFFEFRIDMIEAKFKFNQNKSDEDVKSVIRGLRVAGSDDAADFMERITEPWNG
jgi:transcriptional regulator